jgi:hypothetical protein
MYGGGAGGGNFGGRLPGDQNRGGGGGVRGNLPTMADSVQRGNNMNQMNQGMGNQGMGNQGMGKENMGNNMGNQNMGGMGSGGMNNNQQQQQNPYLNKQNAGQGMNQQGNPNMAQQGVNQQGMNQNQQQFGGQVQQPAGSPPTTSNYISPSTLQAPYNLGQQGQQMQQGQPQMQNQQQVQQGQQQMQGQQQQMGGNQGQMYGGMGQTNQNVNGNVNPNKFSQINTNNLNPNGMQQSSSTGGLPTPNNQSQQYINANSNNNNPNMSAVSTGGIGNNGQQVPTSSTTTPLPGIVPNNNVNTNQSNNNAYPSISTSTRPATAGAAIGGSANTSLLQEDPNAGPALAAYQAKKNASLAAKLEAEFGSPGKKFGGVPVNEITSEKFKAIQKMTAQKTRDLMRSINILQEENKKLKQSRLEHNRSEAFKSMCGELGKQDAIIDGLFDRLSKAKQELSMATGSEPLTAKGKQAILAQIMNSGIPVVQVSTRQELKLDNQKLKAELARVKHTLVPELKAEIGKLEGEVTKSKRFVQRQETQMNSVIEDLQSLQAQKDKQLNQKVRIGSDAVCVDTQMNRKVRILDMGCGFRYNCFLGSCGLSF